MTAAGALRDGMRRVLRAPAIVAGAWIVTVLASLPLAIVVRGAIAAHLGASVAADTAASGVNYDWWQEFDDQSTGAASTFRPTIIGFGAVLDNLSAFVDNEHRPAAIVGAAATYLLVWLFLAGGIIDRYARDRATRANGFFAACGVFLFRFLRLGIVMAIVYGFLFRYLHPWLFERLYPRMIRDVDVERTAFFARLVLYVVFGVVLAGCNLLFDYAKVRAVVEDRRSMLGALVAAVRFVRRNYGAAVTLYAADFVLFLAVVTAYAMVAPGAGPAGVSTWIGFAVGQAYIVGRLMVKLLFWASETALFQGRLAHAGYIAAPDRSWPESPAAEAIAR